MDFALSAKAEDVCGRMWDFMREHVFPAEPVYERVARRARPRRPRAPAGAGGAEGRGPQARPVEPLPPRAGRAVQPRVRLGRRDHRLVAGHRPRGDQLRRAGHRQHGDAHVVRHRRAEAAVAEPAARGRDPLRLRDDRAGRRVVRRPQHPDLDRPRRRRLRDQRPQVVDQRRRRRALPDLHRHGQDRPRRRPAPPAVDGARAPRHPGPGDHPAPAGVRVPGPARPLGAAVHRRPGAGDQHPRPARATGS